jgi:ribosomal protein S19E (S16A)
MSEIKALTKRRLADEYDAAQERGEVQKHGGQGKRDVPKENIPTVKDIGLTRKQIHEAREIRDAEKASPGIVRQTLNEKLDAGRRRGGFIPCPPLPL